MSSQNDGIVVILSSPSGAGKTTLVKLISEKKNFNISVSHTTRKPRSNEIDGKDYYFVNDEIFEILIKNNQFLEYAKVFNNFYGTSKKPVLELLNSGKNVIFDIDWQGTKQIKEKNLKFKLITFFILPPSKKTLKNRLSERENNNEKIINERMKKFDSDIQHWVDYDFVVINDNLEICLKEITDKIDQSLKNAELSFNKEKIKNHVDFLLK